jgi:hypothetical protein
MWFNIFCSSGVGNPDGSKGQIDGMEPSSKEDFDKFEEILRLKITKYEVDY